MPSLTTEEGHLRGTNHINTLKTIKNARKEKEKREKRKEAKKLAKSLKKNNETVNNDDNLLVGKVARVYINSCLVLYGNQYHNIFLLPENRVTVGDNILLDESMNIKSILPRYNVFNRKAITGSAKAESQILASNVDYVAIYLPCKNPDINYQMMDKMLFAAFSNNLKAILILNKEDMLSPEERQNILKSLETYRDNIYKVFFISARNSTGIDELKKTIKDKITLLIGISGAGKSTFTNLMCPSINLETKEVDQKSGRGKHTTTYSTLIALPDGGFIIDTPGIQTFDIFNGSKETLNYYLKDIDKLSQDCKFNNCTHIAEDECVCAIKQALKNETLNPLTYDRYLNLRRICQ